MHPFTYYQRNKDKILANLRRTRLTTKGGQVLHNLNKRPYTNACELCKDVTDKHSKPIRLFYHHWDKKRPNLGLWVCSMCHFIVEFLGTPEAMDIFMLYSNLKNATEKHYAATGQSGPK